MLRLFDAVFFYKGLSGMVAFIYIYTIYLLIGYEALGCVFWFSSFWIT